jgi:exoribonuclease-2
MTLNHRQRLAEIARRAMVERGLSPEFSPEALAQLRGIGAAAAEPGLPDLRGLLWCSIDNDDSRDLDQLSVAEPLSDGTTRVRVAIADVDGLVRRETPLDRHAQQNTTSVYTAGGIFPMLPEQLSTDLTSLNAEQDRDALIIEYQVDASGTSSHEKLSLARVRNRAKLTYRAVGLWLEGQGPLPEIAARVPGMEAQLRLQDAAAQRLRQRRCTQGALDFDTIEPTPVFRDGRVTAIERQLHNRGTELIEELMVASNGVTARYLGAARIPSLRRVVRVPKRWDRIVAYAANLRAQLPAQPDAAALERFLAEQRVADPLRFPDLSIAIIKMLGSGEYVVESPGQAPVGHFGLAVRDYTHSTAPNRRFPDLITQRMVKAALAQRPPAYLEADLVTLAAHCTAQENAADKVERQLRKCAAAILLEHRIHEHFGALVTGASEKGTWVRCLSLPVEGRLIHTRPGLDIGERVNVKLVSVDVERGFVDFSLA